MATNKAKRPILLAQPQPQHAKTARVGDPRSKRRNPNPESAELMPVKARVYRAIAELNGGFEKVIQDLQTVSSIAFFRSDNVTAMHGLLCRIRAQANHELIAVLNNREAANLGHFDQLCIEHQKTQQAAGS